MKEHAQKHVIVCFPIYINIYIYMYLYVQKAYMSVYLCVYYSFDVHTSATERYVSTSISIPTRISASPTLSVHVCIFIV